MAPTKKPYAGLMALVTAVSIEFAFANSSSIVDLSQLKALPREFNQFYNVTVNSGQDISIRYEHDYKGVRKFATK